ncbi:acyltransferase [Haliangium sp.]|uniref:acyltransferase n=1 Tax=Haliangium sp. TaxID=2663208 RepID=UPI003D0DACEF
MAQSHGTGVIERHELAACGEGVVFEPGALVFHPENVEIGADVYIGHYAILKGYYRNKICIGDGAWIGQQAYLHGAGGLTIGRRVGIGPGVRIITSTHSLPEDPRVPIMEGALNLAEVVIEDGCDLGVGTVVLPGVRIGAGVQVGAGAVVSRDLPAGAVCAGVPARVLRYR